MKRHKSEQMCDFIIVGGGTTGCVVASRLSEDSKFSVVLLEEGPKDTSPYIHIPATYYKTAQGSLLKRLVWVPSGRKQGTRVPTMVQARVLGGGSSVNAMIYIRGNPQDYDDWEAAGATGWSYAQLLPYFMKAEDNNRFCNEVHAIGGPVGVSDINHIHPLTRAWLHACQQCGLNFNPDFNSGSQAGCGLYQITARDARRESAATAYLKPARRRKNLDIRVKARVMKILFENRQAVGVIYERTGNKISLRARRGVVVCAGAIATPQLLMVSGVGPGKVLQNHGIDVIADLPGVGQNLQDHTEISLIYQLNGPHSYDKYKKLRWKIAAGLQYLLFKSGPASSNLIEGGAFWWGNQCEKNPDIQFFMVVGAGIEEGIGAIPGGNGCTINLGQIRPHSRGQVNIQSADPKAAPVIVPNYFADDYDLDAITQGTMTAMNIMSQPAISRFIAARQTPSPSCTTRDQIRDFCREEAHAALHPAGTCRMGCDRMAVVDPQLSVHSTHSLYVADASIMPNLISGNPNAVCIMIGEKFSDMLKSTHQE